MKFKAIVLDFDGVIVESVGIKDQAFEELFKSYPDKLEEIMDYHLNNNAIIRYDKFRHIYENVLGLEYTGSIESEINNKFSEIIVDKIINCPFVDGAEDFLNHFSNKCSLYIASINPQEEFERVLKARKLDRFFRDIFVHPWKKVDALNTVIQREGVSADQIIFIGDSPEDASAGLAAKVNFIGRDSGKALVGNFEVFKNLNEIKTFIES